MNSCSNLISETTQANLEESLLQVFKSDKIKTQGWLGKKLKNIGIENQFATIIARREGASEDLLKLNPREINHFIHSLIKEFKEAGFSEKIALTNPGRLREFKRLDLPVSANTIRFNPQTLLKNKEGLERLGLPVNASTIVQNPKSVAKKAKRLKKHPLKTTIS